MRNGDMRSYMRNRPRGRFTEVDPDNPVAVGTCARCGFRFQMTDLSWQWDFRGTATPVNTKILVCTRPSCMDVANPQMSPLILSADPEPVFNARPFPYVLEESSWLMTQDGEIITSEDGTEFATALPNPATPAVPNSDSIIEEAAVNITTEDGLEIVTEEGDGNPLNLEPNPGPGPGYGPI